MGTKTPVGPRAGLHWLNGHLKAWVRAALPLAFRKRLAIWIGSQTWLAGRGWWSTEIVRDLAERDADAYHRFLWTHHLAYAETYEVAERFGADKLHPSRRILVDDLVAHLQRGSQPAGEVRSVLDVGCSMGYVLRFLETSVFHRGDTFLGVDIDRYAVARGAEYLRALGSRVELCAADVGALDEVLRGRRFDVVICLGVLMYLTEAVASRVVEAMLRHTSGTLAVAGLAHPTTDNADLPRSERRARDKSWIHNVDAMVYRAGGEVVYRRWEGPRSVSGNTIYFLFCRPAPGGNEA